MFSFRITTTAATIAACFATTTAYAIPMVSLHSSNSGIGSISTSISGNTITIEENWDSLGIGVLEISGLEDDINYTLTKNINNNSGSGWNSFANELLDPSGDSDDRNNDPTPQPAFVPTGFSTSSDADGLSFAQGSGIARTSNAFSDVFVDELTDERDFIDFDNGIVPVGGSDTVSFGLRDNNASSNLNQPFLLAQRPNERSVDVPAPGGLALLLGGLVAMGATKRFR